MTKVRGYWSLEGHPKCRYGECGNTCHDPTCAVNQGMVPDPDPVLVLDPDCDFVSDVGPTFNEYSDTCINGVNGHWGIEGHPNCSPGECDTQCKNVFCGIYLGYVQPVPKFFPDSVEENKEESD